MKKKPAKKWAKENNKSIAITGVLKEEGGVRGINASCLAFSGKKLVRFSPFSKISKEWEEWFINKYNIQLCKLYYPPYNFKRTGCKGCPFNLELQKDLETMKQILPAERKQCEYIWEPIYKEYRRIGYRLRYDKDWKGGDK